MTTDITFGTDGWRAVIADGYTFDNVRRVSGAIAVAARGLEPPSGVDRNALVVGYDRRFLSREFAAAVAEVLSQSGYRVVLADRPTPSQTIAFTAFHRRILGGIVVTASHNPAKYNGLKFKQWYGGSALPETYAAIAASLGRSERGSGGSISEENIVDDYLAAVRAQLDVDGIRRARLTILHDSMHGVAASLPSQILGLTGSAEQSTVVGIRGETNPGFGGVNPEPIPENLRLPSDAMRSGQYHLAICNDGDADRLGILDERGEFVSPHKIIALLALYLVREKKMTGEIVKTFSTTRLVEKVARALGTTLHETPVGFKYVADLMLTREVLVGGEESGGIGFGHFLPERDGILSGLMVAEAVAHYGRPLSEVIARMEDEFGVLHYDRRDLQRPMDRCERLVASVRRGDLDAAFGSDLASREEKDGVKLNFVDGSWILFRRSGTEPMIRIYAESPSQARVGALLDVAVAALDRV